MDDSLMQIARSNHFQFTMSDMLLMLATSFVGMALIVPVLFRDDRLVGCIAVEVTTIGGAMISLRCTRLDTPDRSAWLFSGAIFGWLGAVLFQLLNPIRGDVFAFFVVVAVIFSPTLAGALISYSRTRRAERENLPRAGVWTPLIVCAVANVLLIAGYLPAYLRNDCGGRSEIAAAASCKAFAEAEEIYHRTDYTGTGVIQYAQHLHGANSLLETTPGAGNLALIDKTFGGAEIGTGMSPKAGYVFKVLKGQGPNATGGRKSYLDANGNMVGGYALVARPWSYGNGYDSKTYMICGNGTIFEADLGPNTAAIVDQMTEFDPGPQWEPTQ